MNSSGGYFCPRCQKRVYFAEEIIAIGKHWHKSCFSCASCQKRLDSRTCTERNDEIYCSHCYARLFGPKGYGYGQGAGTLSMDNGVGNGQVTSNISSYAQAQVAPLLDESPRSNQSSASSPSVASPTDSAKTVRSYGGSETCHRCGKPVYLAERMISAGSVWHKMTCFTCAECNRRLESTSLCDKDGELYCKTCYGRKFGPKGYGYGVGAGTLQMQQ